MGAQRLEQRMAQVWHTNIILEHKDQPKDTKDSTLVNRQGHPDSWGTVSLGVGGGWQKQESRKSLFTKTHKYHKYPRGYLLLSFLRG